MTDVNKIVAELLENICALQPAFPEVSSDFPYVSLTEIDNSSAAVLSGAERYSRYECQLDVWDSAKNGNTPEYCNSLALQISSAMIAAGFTRNSGKYVKDPSGLHRYTMDFVGWVDNNELKIYRGGF